MGNHDELFEAYVRQLRHARTEADAWWRELQERERSVHGDAADSNLRLRWPCGPASHPRVLGVVLEFSRCCEELNKTSDEVIDPFHLVGEWLINDETRDLAEFMDALSYWPFHLM